MAAVKPPSKNTGMVLVITYISLFIVNALIIFAANLLFPYWVVLGTLTIPLFWAVAHSAGVLAIVNTFAVPFFNEYEKMRGKMLTSKEWMAGYFIVNFVGLWLIARFPDQFGLGIRSWAVAVILAVILDVLQGIVMMRLKKFQTSSS